MQQVHEEIIQTVSRARLQLSELDLADQATVAAIGRALEETIQELPPRLTGLIDLLTLVLDALQAIYQGDSPDAPRLARAAAEGLAAAELYLLSEGGPEPEVALEAAGQALGCALGHPTAFSPAGPLSLDDAAALLLQCGPADTIELGRVRDGLQALVAGEPLPSVAAALAVQAAQTLGSIVLGRAANPARALAEVGHLIQSAMDAMERSVPDSTPPAPAPAEAAPASDGLPADADPALLAEFILESREYIEAAEAALLSLETNPEDDEAVNTVFRVFHTVKGTSAFLGLRRISELAHGAESLLSRVRDHEIRFTGSYADLALRSTDMLRELIQAVQNALGGEPMHLPAGYAELLRLLEDPETLAANTTRDDLPLPRLGDLLVAQGVVTRADVEAAATDQGNQPLGLALVKSGAASIADVAKALRTQQRLASGDAPAAESWVRVRTDRLDKLIDMVGELVIAHSMVAQDETVVDTIHHELSRKVIHAGKIVRELQDLSLSMRMVPLKATFQKMARLVRDVAHKSGKQVDLIVEGEDTEIDRHMVDVINDPLIHMIRNAVDHGIEPPDVRVQHGKPPAGVVRLAAYHSGGNVVVEIEDDGRGLDREKIASKALARGLIESDKGLSDNDVFNLIFEPGFSTADQVTDVSGRGVGMDVVKRNVQALRGRIDIASTPGKGTRFSLRLPLTLAITDGMLVKVGDERYIIPLASIALSFRPEPRSLSTVAGRGELVMLRGDLLPVLRLHRLFHVPGAVENPTQGLLVVVGEGELRCALLVDELLGQQQVVAKSLGGIGKIQGVAGGAILGDGRVGLILDPAEVVALARQTDVDTPSVPVIPSVA